MHQLNELYQIDKLSKDRVEFTRKKHIKIETKYSLRYILLINFVISSLQHLH